MIALHGMPQADADALRAGNPCRCCLRSIPKGAAMLICAYKPFSANQPYAETGPIFLCVEACENSNAPFPEVLTSSPDYLLKGYTADERILYGTGQVTASGDVAAYAASLLAREEIAFVDVRSARNNCWQARITRR